MDMQLEYDIEEVDDAEPNATCSAAVTANEDIEFGKSNAFKQSTLDSFVKCSPKVSFQPRKRCSNINKSFTVTTTAVDEEEKQMFLRSKGTTSRYAMVVSEADLDKPSCSKNEILRLGATIKKARRNSLYKYFVNSKEEMNRTEQASGTSVDADKDFAQKTEFQAFCCMDDLHPNLKSLSRDDFVFIDVDSIKTNIVPKPYPPSNSTPLSDWSESDRYVKLPFSPDNSRYGFIAEALKDISSPLITHFQLEGCLQAINGGNGRNFDLIEDFFEEVLDRSTKEKYLNEVLPFMARLALSAPSLITKPIPVLRRGFNGSLTFSQQQVAALLAHAFFCTYEKRNAHYNSLPSINFEHFFDKKNPLAVQKLRCILHYFNCIYDKMPCGVITYRRQSKDAPDWKNLQIPLSKFAVCSSGTIEDDGLGMLEIDFANKYIGGGVLNRGCVQEEIRFLICPELILSCLFCERMGANEAIIISGAQRYSNYIGYGRSFEWRPYNSDFEDVLRDRFGRYLCEVVAIDALHFPLPYKQFDVKAVDRELQKAYSGFYAPNGSKKGIATGNWGCGVYHGDPHLKSLVQLIAASANEKPLCYFTFHDLVLATELRQMYTLLAEKSITVG